MRVRNRKGSTELLEANPQYVILNPTEAKGKWHEIFGNNYPIHVEVGSGKGAFISGMAKAHPKINYIGIDIGQGFSDRCSKYQTSLGRWF